MKTLHAWCTANNIECYVMPAVKAMDVRFSSSLVREALQTGDVVTAAQFWAAHTASRAAWPTVTNVGRTLGFPTINLPLWNPLPLSGVYAVRVYGVDIAGSQAVIGRPAWAYDRPSRKTATLCWRYSCLISRVTFMDGGSWSSLCSAFAARKSSNPSMP